MKNDAAQWFEMLDNDNIDVIKHEFQENYWRCRDQMNFKNKLSFGQYKPGEGTMAEYALRMARVAKTLVPPMSDQEIIYTLKEHFDNDVARELRPSVIHTISDMVNMIETIESERELRKLKYKRNVDKLPTGRPYVRGYQNPRVPENQNYKWENKKTNNIPWRKLNYDKESKKSVDITELPDKEGENPKKTSYVRGTGGERNNYATE